MSGKRVTMVLAVVSCSALVFAAFAVAKTIRGNHDDNTINGTEGPDKIIAKGGDDTVNGNGGDDKVFAGRGADTVNGGPGNDVLKGQAGNDELNGEDGDDRLIGGKSVDTLDGGPGDDFIKGRGDGNKPDQITCGDGFDDTVKADRNDVVAADCENVHRSAAKAKGPKNK